MIPKPFRVLSDYFSLQRGTTYKSRLLNQPGPILLGLGSLQRDGGFRASALKTYGGDSPEKLLVRPGDLYVSLKDVTQSGDLLGAVARVPADVSLGRLTQDTVKLVPKDSEVPIAYLHWVLRTPQYRDYCRAHATGTTNLGLPREDFLAFPIPEPGPRQKLIVDLLDALDNKIELNRKMNQTLEAMAKAIFKSWFVDFDPVVAKAEGRKPFGMSEEIAALFPDSFQETSEGPIPEGWEFTALSELFEVTAGQSPPGSTYNESGEGSPFYQGRRDFTFRFPNRRVYCTAPTRFAMYRDTLVSVRAPVGDINMAIEDCAIGRGIASVRHKEGSYSFAYYTMWSLANQLNVFEGGGTVFGSISNPELSALSCVSPSNTVLRAFRELVEPIDDRIERNYRENATLVALRDTLLPNLLSGELRVKDAESFLAEVAV